MDGEMGDEQLDALIENDEEVQQLIDEINALDDMEDELEDAEEGETRRSPFDVEGTFYDGGTGDAVGEV